MRSTMLSPFQAMDALMNGMNYGTRGEDGQTVLKPRVDILEGEADFRVVADLPGVEKGDLKIELENGSLLIEAERKAAQSEGFQARRLERVDHARYRRSFHIGDEIDVDKISAEFLNGVLTLTLPKREKALPRRIEVR